MCSSDLVPGSDEVCALHRAIIVWTYRRGIGGLGDPLEDVVVAMRGVDNAPTAQVAGFEIPGHLERRRWVVERIDR